MNLSKAKASTRVLVFLERRKMAYQGKYYRKAIIKSDDFTYANFGIKVVITDPTTHGISDSTRAMTYDEPKKGE